MRDDTALTRLLSALTAEQRPVAQLWAALGLTPTAFSDLLSAARNDLAAAGVELHTVSVSQIAQGRLYVEVGDHAVTALSLPKAVLATQIAQGPGVEVRGTLAEAAHAADGAAARGVLTRYRSGLAAETRRAQDADLARWAAYLTAVGVEGAVCSWGDDASSWGAVSWGLVEGFIVWQEAQGYARASIARALSTVRAYATQASRAGALPPDALRLIETVKAPSNGKAARNRDAQRETTRRGAKKATHTPLTPGQVRSLKNQPTDTPKGRRDGLVMCLLLDHGLRVSEVADLRVTDMDTARGLLSFYRRKVDKTQIHTLTPATLRAAKRYMAEDAPAAGQLIGTVEHRAATTLGAPIAAQGIRELVGRLGRVAGVEGLSPHDCRHFWATAAARAGVDPLRLQEAGGWSSLTMPRRYVEASTIANAGMPLPDDDDDGC
jgi:integrase